MVQVKTGVSVVAAHSVDGARPHLESAEIMMAVLSKGLLQDSRFAAILFMVEHARQTNPLKMSTVLADTNFAFPEPEFFAQLEDTTETMLLAKGLRSSMYHECGAQLSCLLCHDGHA